MSIKFDDLINRYCAGLIEPHEFDDLQSLMRSKAEYRRLYFDKIRLHSDLHELADISAGSAHEPLGDAFVSLPSGERKSVLETDKEGASRHGVAWMVVASIASTATLFLVMLVWIQSHSISSQQIQRPIVVSATGAFASNQNGLENYIETPAILTDRRRDSIALLCNAVDVVWADGQAPIRIGDNVFASSLLLESGLIELGVSNGAMVVIDGPANFEVISARCVVLHHGKARCFVPPSAEGFVLETTITRHVDMGTEFGVEVSVNGQEEVQCSMGKWRSFPPEVMCYLNSSSQALA